jgi:ureidoglycolate hydrolase
MMMSAIKTITSANFRRYGTIIDYPDKKAKGAKRNLWRIVHREEKKVGWRIAYLVLRDKTVGRLECHPDSDETFEPVRGRALFFVSKDLGSLECFYLDKPFVLKKGIWHALLTLTPETEIKITENVKVSCRYQPLRMRLDKDNINHVNLVG